MLVRTTVQLREEGTSPEALNRAYAEVKYRLDHIAQGLHQSSSEYLQKRGFTAFVEEPVLVFDYPSC